MMPSHGEENAKTLAAMLGIEEEEAAGLLNASAVVSYSMSDHFARRTGIYLQTMLARTIRRVESSTQLLPDPDVEIVIGEICPQTQAPRISVRFSEAEILISPSDIAFDGQGAPHDLFAILTACHACAISLHVILGDRLGNRGSKLISIKPSEILGEDIDCLSEPVDLGEAVLAGAGAVSNGFLLALHHLNARGHLTIVDPKKVRDGALNRCLFFEASDVGFSKADRLSARAQSSFENLRLLPYCGTVHDFIKTQSQDYKIRRMIVGVDSRRVRRSLQNEFPGEVFDASTTGVDEVVLHFNTQPNEFACMSCIYKEEPGETSREAHIAESLGVNIKDVRSGFVDECAAHLIAKRYAHLAVNDLIGTAYDSLFKTLCSVGQLKQVDGTQVLAPFSFVSALAGTYLALELCRRLRRNNVIQPFNYWRVSPWYSPVVPLRQTRPRLDTCEFCSIPIMRHCSDQLWGVPSISLRQ